MNIKNQSVIQKNINSKPTSIYSKLYNNKNRILSNSFSMKQFSPISMELKNRRRNVTNNKRNKEKNKRI